jgi:hypothetical protein
VAYYFLQKDFKLVFQWMKQYSQPEKYNLSFETASNCKVMLLKTLEHIMSSML